MDSQGFDNRNWSDAVADRLRDDEMPISDGVWSRIEMSEQLVAAPPRRWSLAYGAMAAAAVVAVGLFVWDGFVESVNEELVNVDGGSYVAAISDDELPGQAVAVIDDNAAEVSNSEILGERVMSRASFVSADELVLAPSSSPSSQLTESEPSNNSSVEAEDDRVADAPQLKVVDSRIGVNPNVVIPSSQHQPATALSLNVGGGLMQSNAIAMAVPRVACSSLFVKTMSLRDPFESDYRSAEINHRQPFSVALSAGRSLSNRLRVVSGLEFSQLTSDLKIGGEDMVQRLRLLGLPLRLDVSLYDSDHLSLYLGAGGRVERLLSAKVGDRILDEEPWHYSLSGVVGVEYRLGRLLSLYCEPDLSYFFTQTKSRSIRNDNPVSFNLSFGVRFKL